ncbi:hypothetical protein C477_06601 [Haloterrigena salina JCM 13891]|uniref:Uncharacterized protein n=1 Tax=Haloterrigena salina JCM 13891 TaxID=1227488 RepID=M0CCX5_9EURY|nr:hypothetical protein [Haloterrigena salina]ELZ20483.1 hypothetical protein C477_06601 [Haloterrigena salina JCM 13891]
MDRPVLAGIAIGAAAGGALRVAFGSNWFLIAAVVAIYTGWGYFEVRYRRLRWSEFPAFDRSADRLGHAIGVFGVSIGSVAFGQQYAAGGAGIEFLVGYLGVIGFLLTSSRASADADSD